MVSLPPSLEHIVQRFERSSDPKRKYEQLIWYAKRMKPFPEEKKVSENKVPGCASQVYISARFEHDAVWFEGESDSQLVKGLVGLLIEGLNGLSPAAILQLTPDFIQTTGLTVSLTPSRANGFYNIFKMMQFKASHCSHFGGFDDGSTNANANTNDNGNRSS
ncbi:SufE family protein [Myxacorys almedinensis]|uniref:SufE family protein n=1 Tax=Myxacorys almedinensis A TaxID=2690445 RepID=A0A8J7Z863_9CYAN|nr:SufE family protein [Myxacorys almedinensis]NDJ19808.1 SufE family protein [Myxacorys almedinensis A]